jgi:uncharacterized protein YpmB
MRKKIIMMIIEFAVIIIAIVLQALFNLSTL